VSGKSSEAQIPQLTVTPITDTNVGAEHIPRRVCSPRRPRSSSARRSRATDWATISSSTLHRRASGSGGSRRMRWRTGNRRGISRLC